MALPNEPGYYNNFDPEDNYYEIRAKAGYAEQSREDNEIQAILKHIDKSNWDTIYRNGSLVRGGSFSVDPANTNIINLNSGEVYYNGIVHTVPASQVTLNGTGDETIGVLFTETIVDHVADPTLRDPAVGAFNYGMPGASRLKITKTWVANDPTAATVYKFKNGVLAENPSVGEIDIVNNTLARRTYDESGNYTVAGFNVSAEPKDDSTFYAVIGNTSGSGSSSKAYVQGREIIKLLPERITIEKAIDTRFVDSEPTLYSDHGQPKLYLAERNARDIVKVRGQFRQDNKPITRGGSNTSDTVVPDGQNLRGIYSVTQGATTYVQNTDYKQQGNAVDWSLAGAEPSLGEIYYVSYRFDRELESHEYNIWIDPVTGESYLDLSPITDNNNRPELGYELLVSYNYYLDRTDVIYVGPNGKIDVVRGQSEKNSVAKEVPLGMLGLGEIKIPAGQGYEKAVVTQYNTRRFTMQDLHKILTRLERAEYNQAVRDLDNSAQQYANSSNATLSGILTEGFKYTAEDLILDGVGGIRRAKFDRGLTDNRMLDIVNQELVLPEVQNTAKLSVLGASTTAKKFTNSVTMNTLSEDISLVSQLFATGAIKLNPYGTASLNPTIYISPNMDNETESDTVIEANGSIASQTSLMQTREQFPYNVVSLETERNLKLFSESLKTFIKSGIDIHVKGFGYKPGAHVQCFMDNRKVNLTPVTSTTGLPAGFNLPSGTDTLAGTDGKVQVNDKGEFLAKFTVPTGIPSGIRAVVVSAADGDSAAAMFEGRSLQKGSADLNRVTELVPPPPPSLSNVSSSSYDIVGGTPGTVTFSYDYTGLAHTAVLKLSNGEIKRVTLDQSAGTTALNIVSPTISGPVTYSIYLEGPGGNSNMVSGLIRYGGAGHSSPKPNVSVFNVTPNFSRFGVTPVTINYVVDGLVDKVVVSYSNDQVTYKNEVDVNNLTSSGSISLDAFAVGTITLTAFGPGGLDTRVAQIDVRSTVKKATRRDPIAQTFLMQQPGMVTKVELFFKSKPASDIPITMQIRNVLNGMPGQEVLASKQLATSSVNVSNDASTATVFTLDNPVWLDIEGSKGNKDYCVVILSDSPDYEIFTAKVGSNTIATISRTLTTQPYADGMCFSSNSSVWAPLQDTDLKFNIKVATFNVTSSNIVQFNPIVTTGCTGLFLKVDTVNQNSITTVSWQYQLNGTGSADGAWVNFTPGSYVDFPTVVTRLDIRAIFSGSVDSSALIDLGSAVIKTLHRQLTGSYITWQAEFEEAYTTVRAILTAYAPNGTEVKVYVSDGSTGDPGEPGGLNWVEVDFNAGGTITGLPDGKYSKLEVETSVGAVDPSRTKFRFRLDLSTTSAVVTPRVRSMIAICNE